MARLNVDLDSELLDEVVALSGAASKREAIDIALREFVRRRGLVGIIEHAGSVPLSMTSEELRRSREDE